MTSDDRNDGSNKQASISVIVIIYAFLLFLCERSRYFYVSVATDGEDERKDKKILILKLLDLPSISILCTLLSITIIMNEYIWFVSFTV